MPSKHQSDDLPSVSASSDGSSESDSDQEDQEQSPPPPPPKKNPTESSSDEGSDEDSDEESGEETDNEDDSPEQTKLPNPNIKPINTKPMSTDTLTPNPNPKPNKKSTTSTTTTVTAVTSPKSTATKPKRPLETEKKEKEKAAEPETKKQKKKSVAEVSDVEENGEEKKQLFQRIWSDDDEIAILKGMLSFTAKTGKNAVSVPDEFLEFIKDDLHVEVSRNQLSTKIRNIKRKYEVRAKKGDNQNFSKPHEAKLYELMKKVWGVGGIGNGSDGGEGKKSRSRKEKVNNGLVTPSPKVVSTPKVEGKVEEEEESDDLRYLKDAVNGAKEMSEMPYCVRKFLGEGRMRHVELSKRKEFERKWKSLFERESDIYFEKMELYREMKDAIVEATES